MLLAQIVILAAVYLIRRKFAAFINILRLFCVPDCYFCLIIMLSLQNYYQPFASVLDHDTS